MLTKVFISSFLAAVILCLVGVADAQDDESTLGDGDVKYRVSLVRLIANPSEFDEKPVYVVGYVAPGEPWHLFTDRTSCQDFLMGNAIFFEVTEKEKAEFKKLYGTEKIKSCDVVAVFGTFQASLAYGKQIVAYSSRFEGSLSGIKFY